VENADKNNQHDYQENTYPHIAPYYNIDWDQKNSIENEEPMNNLDGTKQQ